MEYVAYFGLKERPFSIAPDPRFLYLSPQHEEVFAKCHYMIDGNVGPLYVYGPIGAGKTSVARRIHQQLADTPQFNARYLITANLKSANALLRKILDEFAVPRGRSYGQSLDNFEAFLVTEHENGRKPVLIIDEAQNLRGDMLKLVHYLLNYETNTEKLLQIVLFGQHELALNINRFPELKSRMFPAALEALKLSDMTQMILFRLQVAGATGVLFPTEAINAIFRYTHGLPREVCKLCELALIKAYARGMSQVDETLIAEAAQELEIDSGELVDTAFSSGEDQAPIPDESGQPAGGL